MCASAVFGVKYWTFVAIAALLMFLLLLVGRSGVPDKTADGFGLIVALRSKCYRSPLKP
jgi:hypothetical protein